MYFGPGPPQLTPLWELQDGYGQAHIAGRIPPRINVWSCLLQLETVSLIAAEALRRPRIV